MTDLFSPHVLRDYALIADGERGALVGPRGDIVWMCAPQWHSDAVFAALIGGPGIYAITPAGRFVWGGYYEGGTLIWRSRWITEGGIIECREALAWPAAPNRAVLLRQVVARESPAHVDVALDPRAGFGEHGLRSLSRDDGAWTGRAGELYLRWSGEVAGARVHRAGQQPRLTVSLTVPPGQSRDLVLELSRQPLPAQPPDAGTLWHTTHAQWTREAPPLEGSITTRDARQAHVVLRGLTSSSGGMVAAATTSLPERAEEGRNYDYRYAWIRDQCYAGQAAAAAGAYPLLDGAVGFVSGRLHADGPKMAPAYTAARHDRLDSGGWRATEIAAGAIAQRWQEDDAGIWEIDDRAWTHSRLTCVAGLRAAARSGTSQAQGADWSGLADVILADTAARGVHPSGRWQRSPDDPAVDAALLLPPVRGATAADDPRTLQTLHAYLAELTQDGYGYRFRHDERPLGAAEGAFVLCGFIVALALHQQGHEVEATRWFERNRAACGSPGLYSEEYDVAERQLRGNLPQAFVHALLLECAVRLGEPWDAR